MVLELVHKDQECLGLRKQRRIGKTTLPNLTELSSNPSPASQGLQITPTLLASLPASATVKVKSLSRVRLFATPWTVAHQASLSMGFSRQEYWSGLPFPSPRRGIKPHSKDCSLAATSHMNGVRFFDFFILF